MPLQATSGAASYDAFGGGVAAVPNYIEDVFSTYLYTGNVTSRTITNNIDLSTKGGMVWIKNRDGSDKNNLLFDTIRGAGEGAVSNAYSTESDPTSLSSFNTTGFSLGVAASTNGNAVNFRSWSFRQQNNFFEVKSVTKSGVTNFTLSTLGTIGFIIARNDSNGNWGCWHRSAPDVGLRLSSSSISAFTQFISVSGTTVTFNNDAPGNGTYTVYGFAHNAGGFGLTGTDNVISCGSYSGTGTASGPEITLGFEPQLLMIKTSTGFDTDWTFIDNMRGLPVVGNSKKTQSNTLQNDTNLPSGAVQLTPTGFKLANSDGNVNGNATYIYMAIRRGPMKVPTDATKVFAPTLATANAPWFKPNFVVDTGISGSRSTTDKTYFGDRLRGANLINSNNTNAEFANGGAIFSYNNGWNSNTTANSDYIGWNFQRAPSFFDVVCFTQSVSTGTQTLNHNLGVAPDLVILKTRSVSDAWKVGSSLVSGYANLNQPSAFSGTSPVNTLTATTFGFNAGSHGYSIGTTYVAYLFSTCAGVSKVGTYSGTGTTLQVNCGFTAGARFVLIKRTNEDGGGVSGDWYVWDSARGIVAGNDPYLLLNSSAAEVTTTDYIDTYSAGFEISSTAPAAINASGGTFIFLAIA